MQPAAPRRPGWRAKLAMCALSVAAALAVAEAVAARAHRGAYAFLNIFQADGAYGVRLRARAHTRTRSRLGRVTDVTTNALGFRGPEWTPAPDVRPVPGRVLLLGDSQVFGYGVAWEDSLAPRLARALGGGAEVLDAAVPTWGPTEYVAVLRELLPVYRPRRVVFVANAANDWFETAVGNARRTTERDGWAQRPTPGAPPARWFPGRAFVMGRSHLVLAARELLSHLREPGVAPNDMALRLVRELPRVGRPQGALRSRMSAPFLAAQALCRAYGCEVVAVALPLDVQVDPREWAKYGAGALDLAPTERLLADFVADARDHGSAAVDLLPVLRAASPGAFLPDDYHLSPAGHQAAAEAIAGALTERPVAAEAP